MKKIGIIDIGSNSVRLVIAKISEHKFFTTLSEVKETVRLAQGLGEDLKLQPDRMEKAIQTLKMFKEICSVSQVDEILIAATEAVRKASNKEEFLKKVEQEAGLHIRILSGHEEAYYDYLGVIHSMSFSDGLIMDIGGSSTELIWVKDRKIKESISLPFGAINLTQQFDMSNQISEEKEKKLKQYLIQMYKKVPWLNEVTGIPLIGIGGTIRNIGKIDRKRKNSPLDIAHNYRMSAIEVTEIYQSAASKTLSQRKKIKGLSDDRADIFVGAVSAVCTLLELCQIQELSISGHGVREGLLYEHLMNNGTSINDVLEFSILRLLYYHNMNKKHSLHVYHLARSLYEQLVSVHDISENVDPILKTAAMLHDLGVNIRYYDHHKHSFYMILNSEINGLTHREILMSAYIAASHRKNSVKIDQLHYKAVISKEDVEVIQKLGILLQIASSLDSRMNQNVERIHCTIQEDQVFIKTLAKSNPAFEVNKALESSPYFHKIFNKKLVIL